VVDALRAEQVERFADVFRWPFLAGVGDDRLAEFAATGEDAGELARRKTFFR
jgi:hypothetical protein